jgi:rhodanese-related sulfurtransferase
VTYNFTQPAVRPTQLKDYYYLTAVRQSNSHFSAPVKLKLISGDENVQVLTSMTTAEFEPHVYCGEIENTSPKHNANRQYNLNFGKEAPNEMREKRVVVCCQGALARRSAQPLDRFHKHARGVIICKPRILVLVPRG